MIRKTATNVGIDKIDIYYEDDNLEFFKVFDLTPYFCIGKNSFLIDVVEGTFVQNTEIKIEINDADGNSIFIDVPKYREGTMRRVAAWIYPNNVNGVGNLTIVGELKNVPKEWAGVYNVRYSVPITINKSLSNTQPIRFYNTPSASISEYRKYYLNREWGVSETSTISGSAMSIRTSDKGEYLLNINNKNFDYQYKDAIVHIDGKAPVRIKEVINKNLVKLDIPYTYSSSYENLLNQDFEIEYENEPTYSTSENYQSYAEITLTGIEPFSGDVRKTKTYCRSRGAFDNTKYTLINETDFTRAEMLIDPEQSGSL